MARGKFDRKKLKEQGEYKMTLKQDAKARKAIKQADQQIAEARVNFRWGKEQVELVKRAAEAIGVPYQTYIKQVVYRQALKDVEDKHNFIEAS